MKESGLITLWRILIGLLLCGGISRQGLAQTYNLTFFNQEDRLSSRNGGRNILDDDNGYLWTSSFRGLTRFDGREFMTMHSGSSADIRIDFEDIGHLYKLRTGEFAYLKKEAVLEIFNPQTYQFRTVDFRAYTKSEPIIVSLNVSISGELYVCLEANSGIAIIRYDGDHFVVIMEREEVRKDAIKMPNIGRPKLYVTPFDSTSYLFFDANKGYFFWEKTKDLFTPILLPASVGDKDVWPYFMTQDNNGAWLVSFTDLPGLYTFNEDNELIKHPNFSPNIIYKRYQRDTSGNILFLGREEQSDKYFLYQQATHTLTEIRELNPETRYPSTAWSKDFESYFFLTGGDGLVYGRRPFYNIKPVLARAPKDEIGISMRGMAALENKNILIGSDKGGLFFYDLEKGTTGELLTPSHWPKDLNPVIFSREMVRDPKGTLWLTAYAATSPKIRPAGYLLRFDERRMQLDTFFKIPSRVESMAFINDTLLLTGVVSELIIIELGDSVKTKLLNDFYPNWPKWVSLERIIPLKAPGQFYLLTSDGLFHYNYNQQDLQRITINGNLVNQYLDLYQENEHTLWIGTYGDGLYQYNLQTQELQRFGFRQGLKSDIVCGILPQDDDHLLLSTYNGLYCFDKRTGQASNQGLMQGLMHYEFNQQSYLALGDTSWLFGGMNGAHHISKISDQETNSKARILLSSLQFRQEDAIRDTLLFGPFDMANGVILPAGARRLKLKLSSFDPENMIENQLYYRLYPVSEEWAILPENGELNFSFIPPGQHELQVTLQPDMEPGFILPVFAQWQFFERTWVRVLTALVAFGLLALLFYLYFDRKLLHSKSLQLEENEKFRHRLFAYISHEFKTPLTIVFGLLSRLKTTTQEERIRHDLDIIERHGRAMTSLVNQMIELNDLEVNAWIPQYSAINLPEQLRLIIEQMNPLAESLEVNIEWTTSHEELVQLVDIEKLRVILNNLLNNAIKFSPRGETVQVFLVAEKEQWSLTVKDSGPGIAETDIANVFDIFYQGNRQHDKEIANSGIGLAYVKSVVEAMDGTLSVNNDQGAVFEVIFPARDVPKGMVAVGENQLLIKTTATVLEEDIVTGDQTVILLVEDTSDIANYIMSCFSTDQYQLIWARDGIEGRDKAIQWVPDIIISDVMMPGMSGFELCGTLKKHPATNHIPIIMLTALADNKSRLEGLQAQADVYLEKPFQEETLVLTVANLLNTRHKLAAYYASKLGDLAGPSPETHLTVVQDEFVQRLQEVLATNAADPLFGVEELSNQLFLSRAQLHRKVKAILGQTPSDLLREYRLEKAKLMLRTEPLSIAQIALSCGFNDASYFSKVFTTAYKISPSAYRKQRV